VKPDDVDVTTAF